MENHFSLECSLYLRFLILFVQCKTTSWWNQVENEENVGGRKSAKEHLLSHCPKESGYLGKVWLHFMDLHIPHGGQPSQVSQSLRSHIPSFNLSMRWRSDMLPDRIFVRMIV